MWNTGHKAKEKPNRRPERVKGRRTDLEKEGK